MASPTWLSIVLVLSASGTVEGTPKYPGVPINVYIYELYIEDMRPGTLSEKNWGLFEENGVPVYVLHLTGSGLILANDTTNQTCCIAREGADSKMLQAALDWACGPRKVDCSSMLQGQQCYEPDSVEAHANYAFNSYYHQMRMVPGTCDFNGVAAVTTTNPSHGSCLFDGSYGKNGSLINGGSLAPSSSLTSASPGHALSYISPLVFKALLLAALF